MFEDDISLGNLSKMPPPLRSSVKARSKSDSNARPSLGRRTFSVSEIEDEMKFSLPTNCVVQIHATGVSPSYNSPWRVNDQSTWTGSGFCISGRRIVTNAHCVENCTVLQVQSQDHPKKWRANATSIAHDLDLAIITLEDEGFWKSACTVDLAPPDYVPALYSEVNAIGFPVGGSTICVTKGVISRFDAHLYVHTNSNGVMDGSRNSPGEVFILQVDSAINPGNSGGPAVGQDGKVVGVASSGMSKSQNVGYVIPVSIVHLFLNEVEATGCWSGVCELGIVWRELESDSYRAFIGMKDGDTGVLVEEVAPLGALNGVVFPGDVITSVDGLMCSNEGRVPLTIAGQQVFVPISAIVTSKPKGSITTFSIIRQQAQKDHEGGHSETISKEVSVGLSPIPPLAPRFHAVDAIPEYVLLGGLVFSRLTVPLTCQNVKLYTSGQSEIWIDMELIDSFKRDRDHELVILIRILKHDINIGVPMESQVLDKIDGKTVRSLSHLASIASHITMTSNEALDKKFVQFTFKKTPKLEIDRKVHSLPDIVLDRSMIASADAEICEAHAIPHAISPSLIEGGYEDHE